MYTYTDEKIIRNVSMFETELNKLSQFSKIVALRILVKPDAVCLDREVVIWDINPITEIELTVITTNGIKGLYKYFIEFNIVNASNVLKTYGINIYC